MKYSFTLTGFSDEISPDIKAQFKHLQKLSISFFEPRGINGKSISSLNDEEVEDLVEEMHEFGIKVSSIGSPIGKINITDDFAPHFELFKRTCEIAKKLGTRYIRVFSFFIPQGEDPKIYRDEVIKRLSAMIQYAKENDIILLHENEKAIYGEGLENCVDLMQTLYCNNFKAIFDPANFVQAKQDTKACFNALKSYIAYMHIKDAKEDGSVVPAGYGTGNLKYILYELKEMGYKGFLSIEPHLGKFEGLASLEREGDKTRVFENSDAGKFTLAYEALNSIIERI
ncbi:MAG: sugar phosphate isomerase/epimerase family protein [Bacillota bacterium]|nr:sugar phosphate isomerase/epimerase family protein [Bacillota bacterium]